MKKFLVLAFTLAMASPVFALEEYLSFDNFQNNANFGLSHHGENPATIFLNIGSYSLVRVSKSSLVKGCKDDSICRIDICISRQIFASLYVDVEAIPVKILRYNIIDIGKPGYKIDVNEANNYITVLPT